MTKQTDRRAVARAAAGLLTAASMALFAGPSAVAQDLIAGGDAAAISVDRNISDLRAQLHPRPDVDTYNTALVFNNPGPNSTAVVCVGYNAHGQALGRAKTEIRPNGVRYLLASDLSDGLDFVGSAVCKSRGQVVPSGFLIGGAVTDVRVGLERSWSNTVIRFPLAVSY